MSFFFDVLPAMLVGTAAVEGGAAATAGLIGAGGAVTAGGVATAASLLGTGVSAVGALKASQNEAQGMEAQANASRANAQIAQNEATQQTAATQEKTLELSRQKRLMEGAQIAGYGASGVTEAGSPLEVMANTASQYERDMLMTGYAGDVAAAQKTNEAKIYDWEAENKVFEAKQKRTTGAIGAGTTLLSGAGQLGYSMMGSKNYFQKV